MLSGNVWDFWSSVAGSIPARDVQALDSSVTLTFLFLRLRAMGSATWLVTCSWNKYTHMLYNIKPGHALDLIHEDRKKGTTDAFMNIYPSSVTQWGPTLIHVSRLQFLSSTKLHNYYSLFSCPYFWRRGRYFMCEAGHKFFTVLLHLFFRRRVHILYVRYVTSLADTSR